MITSIIFSKNRACQLDLLLRSIQQNLPNFQEIFVLYHYTTSEFAVGYEKLINKFPNFSFVPQTDFEQNTRTLLNLVGDVSGNKYVCFFVDDNIIYRKCDLDNTCIDALFCETPELTCFTLRLGANTVIQDQYNNIPTVFPQKTYHLSDFFGGWKLENEKLLFWDWTTVKVFGDFGYPFSVDGHIYKVSDLLPLLNYEFDTPNAFEGRFDKNTFSTNLMGCFEQSVLVNNPLNIVGSSNNNAGLYWGHTLEELNQKYLDGYQISLNSIMEKKIFAAHQEIEIEYEKV